MPKDASAFLGCTRYTTNEAATTRKQPPIQLEAIRCSRDNANRPNRLQRNARSNSGLDIQVSIRKAKLKTRIGMTKGASAGLDRAILARS
jgi:hypothetical protein